MGWCLGALRHSFGFAEVAASHLMLQSLNALPFHPPAGLFNERSCPLRCCKPF